MSFKVFRFALEACAYYKWTSFLLTYELLCPTFTFRQRILAALVTVSNHVCPVEVKVTIFLNTRQTIIHNCHFRHLTLFNNAVSASSISCPFLLTSPPLRSTCEVKPWLVRTTHPWIREAWWRRCYDWGVLKTMRMIVTSFRIRYYRSVKAPRVLHCQLLRATPVGINRLFFSNGP